MIAIIDYGAGNLFNAQKAFAYLGYDAVVTADESVIKNAKGLVLPGVGAFPDAMEALKGKGLDEMIRAEVQKGKSLLGICLGMQLLFDSSEEMGGALGLSLLKGKIRKINTPYKIPHMGWNRLHYHTPNKVFEGIGENEYVYFVHSFCAEPQNREDLIAYAGYGEEITGGVANGNVMGMQYHPEKSSKVGMKMLDNWAKYML